MRSGRIYTQSPRNAMSDAVVTHRNIGSYYAIRRGRDSPRTRSWGLHHLARRYERAMNAGWYRQQGRGHAARFTDLDDAEAWMSATIVGGDNFVYMAVRR